MKHIFATTIALFTLFITKAISPTDSIGTSNRHGKEYIIHQVEAGETLYKISKTYSSSVESIQKENTNTQSLAVGQKLFIPTGRKVEVASVKTHSVQKGEGLYGISKKYNVTVDQIKKWNGMSSNNLSLGQKLIVSAPIANKPSTQTSTTVSEITHTVQKGDGLYSIAKKYNVSVEQIQKLNNLSSSSISLGQVLKINKNNAIKLAPRKTNTKPQTTTTGVNHPQKLESSISLSSTSRQEEKGQVGFASLSEYNSKFSYGLHKTAPIGTVVKVVNEAGQVHWVRIMGQLDSNETSILKVNKTVLEKIGGGQTLFNATISYVL